MEDVCCFGMIVDLSFKVAEDIQITKSITPIELSEHGNSLLDHTNKSRLGTLSPSSRKILEVLTRELSVELFVSWTALPSSWLPEDHTKANRSRQRVEMSRKADRGLQLRAILYGREGLFEHIGRFTAKCNLFLQHPQGCSRNVPYRNPHCLSLAEDVIVNTFDLDAHLDLEMQNMDEDYSNPIDLFADPVEHDCLASATAPKALSTELYKHQKQALTFMMARERGWSLAGHPKDIWRAESDPLARVSYVNCISGHKQRTRPPEFRGGLLIDAPGLGKSLSVLSLIASDQEDPTFVDCDSQIPKNTLLVVPNTLIHVWKAELKKHFRANQELQFSVYYGKDRINHLKTLRSNILIITTYSIVRLDWKRALAEPENLLALHRIKWRRIVLDEAHIIREPSTTFARSVCALEADRRWAVTGTPIQNRLTDLLSLFVFLRCSPFDSKEVFAAQVTRNWKSRSDPASIAKLKTLINCLSLRRPKDTIQLLPRHDHIVNLEFNQQEKDDYARLKQKTQINIDAAGRAQDSTPFINALQWLNEQRLMCNLGPRATHPSISLERSLVHWDAQEAQAQFDLLDQACLVTCSNPSCGRVLSSSQCSEDNETHEDDPSITQTLELWCSVCYREVANHGAKAHKICHHLPRRAKGAGAKADRSIPSQKGGDSIDQSPPTKIKRLVKDLLETPEGIKSVVFSAWSKTFDIVQPQLSNNSIRCVRLDGSLSPSRRAGVLNVFASNPGISVLLATISCGGVGLDLTAASRAYIMEPQWNPMSESQALDRVYRLGQEKEVTTIRYIMRGSYEELVLKLQRKKKELADLTVNQTKISREELTHQRLQWLKSLVG